MEEKIISLTGVSKTYRKGWFGKPFFAIRDVCLEVLAGESVGFIGHNGAGKSSTIRIIMGLQRPTTGIAMLNGRTVEDPESRRSVAYVPENPLAYDYLTPREFVLSGMAMSGVGFGDVSKQALGWLDRFGIAYAADKPLRGLSKGMVQRTILAHALAMKPKLLILDEPLSGLDPLGRAEVVEILQDYRRQGGTLLFSSHILTDVERLADRFVFIHQGAIRATCGVYDILGGEGQRFEVLAEFQRGCVENSGWTPLGKSSWLRVSNPDELGDVLRRLPDDGGRLLSVRNVNSLENVYLRLVKEAGAPVRGA